MFLNLKNYYNNILTPNFLFIKTSFDNIIQLGTSILVKIICFFYKIQLNLYVLCLITMASMTLLLYLLSESFILIIIWPI